MYYYRSPRLRRSIQIILTHLKSTRQKTVIKKTVEHVRSLVQHIIVSKKILPIIIIIVVLSHGFFIMGAVAILST